MLAALARALEWALATRGLQRWLGVRLEGLVLLVTAAMVFAAMGLLDSVRANILALAVRGGGGGRRWGGGGVDRDAHAPAAQAPRSGRPCAAARAAATQLTPRRALRRPRVRS